MYNFIQVGLNGYCEYHYLVIHNSSPYSKMHSLPQNFPAPGKDWNYYGICANPKSVSDAYEKYKTEHNSGKTYFGCIAITSERGCAKTKEDKIPPIPMVYDSNIVFCITLDDLIDYLGLEDIEGLCLDIEGAEYEVIKDYSWKIKPRFLQVEFHKMYGHHRLSCYKLRDFLVNDIGYSLIPFKGINRYENHDTAINMQFVLK